MGRSNAVPVLGKSPGWRFTVIRRGGIANPEFASAACTRSRLSFTAVAARPTSVIVGMKTLQHRLPSFRARRSR